MWFESCFCPASSSLHVFILITCKGALDKLMFLHGILGYITDDTHSLNSNQVIGGIGESGFFHQLLFMEGGGRAPMDRSFSRNQNSARSDEGLCRIHIPICF